MISQKTKGLALIYLVAVMVLFGTVMFFGYSDINLITGFQVAETNDTQLNENIINDNISENVIVENIVN